MFIVGIRRFATLTLTAALIAAVTSACGGAASREQRHMARGNEYFLTEKFDKARVEFRNALQIAPNDPEARYMNGRAAEKLGNLREAAQFYQGTIDVATDHVGARANLGRMYVFAGVPQRAIGLVDPALKSHPNAAELLTVRAAAKAQMQDATGALADAERAVQLDPTNENAVALLASLYRQGGQTAKAVTLLQTSLVKLPKSVDLHQVLAALYIAQGDKALAEEQLKIVTTIRPAELALRYQLALFYAKDKRLDAAERELQAGIAANPDSDEARLAFTEFLASQRSPERGVQALRQFIAAQPENYDLQLGLGALLQRTGKTEDAVATYQKIIDRDGSGPKGLAARNRIAAVRLQSGHAEEASKLIAEVLKQNPRDSDALLLRGNLALEKRDPAAAIADLRAVLRDQPANIGVLRVLARAHLANGEPALAEENLRTASDAAPTDVNTRIELAQLLMQTARSPQAVALLEKLVQQTPNDVQAREALLRAYLAKNDINAAKLAAEDLATLRPDAAVGYFYQGLIAQNQKRLDAAAGFFAKALSLQPDAADSLAALARVQVLRGRSNEAITTVQAVTQRSPTNALAHNLLGELYLAGKDPAKALEQLTEASRLAPKWWLPYRNLAFIRLGVKDVPGAIAIYEKGIAASGGEPTLVGDAAALYERQGQFDAAIRSYEQLLQRQPQLDLARNNLAMLLVTYRSDAQSLKRSRELTAGFSGSTNAALLDTHGWVLYKAGQFAEALPSLERAAAQAPDAALMRYHLGMTQMKIGNTAQAKENLKLALASKTTFAGIDDARAALRAIAPAG
jgi:tetratricopeptide (TPR) repeat protein